MLGPCRSKKTGRSMNPADTYRRAQRKKEMQKNKMKKKAAREANTFEDDAAALEEEIEKLERKEGDSHSASRKMELRMRREALLSRLRSIPAHLRRGSSGEGVSVYLEGKKGRRKLDGGGRGYHEDQDLTGIMGEEGQQLDEEERTDEFYTEEYEHLYGYDARGWPIPPPPPPLTKDGVQSHRPLPVPFMGPPHLTPVRSMAPPPPPPGFPMHHHHQHHHHVQPQPPVDKAKPPAVNDDVKAERAEMKIDGETAESMQDSGIDWSKKRKPVRKGIARTKGTFIPQFFLL
jgi:hypothetical protein